MVWGDLPPFLKSAKTAKISKTNRLIKLIQQRGKFELTLVQDDKLPKVVGIADEYLLKLFTKNSSIYKYSMVLDGVDKY